MGLSSETPRVLPGDRVGDLPHWTARGVIQLFPGGSGIFHLSNYPYSGKGVFKDPRKVFVPGGELPYEEYMGVCHELGSHFQEKIPKRVCQFFTKIPERAIISVRNSI